MDQAELLTLRLANLDADDLRHALRHALLNQSVKAKGMARRGNREALKTAQKMYKELEIIVQTAEAHKKFK